MSTDAAILALRFSTSAGATVFEIDFKKIDYDGFNSRIWSEIATRGDNKNARIQLLPYMIRGPVTKEEGNKKDYSRICLACLD